MTNPNLVWDSVTKCAECGEVAEDHVRIYDDTLCEDGDCGHPHDWHSTLAVAVCRWPECPCPKFDRHAFKEPER